MFLKVKSYDNGKPIIFGLNAMRTPFSVALSANDVLPDAANRLSVQEGSFIVALYDGTIRFLPRARTKNAVVTTSPTVTLLAPSFSFKVGDVLKAKGGYGTYLVQGTAATGDIVTVRIAGVNYSATIGATQTPQGAAAAIAAITGLPTGVSISQIGSTAGLLVVASDSHKVEFASSSGALVVTGNSSEPGYLGDNIVPLGTIQSIGAANVAGERVITLTANAAYALPANTSVGVDIEKFLGVYNEQLDFTELPVEHLAPIYHADGVYENNLPYCDKQIKRILHGLNINKKFYRNV